MDSKTCRRCKTPKPKTDFRADPRYRDGLGSWCASCHREKNSEWAKEHRQRLNAKAAEWREENRDKMRQINRKFKRNNIDRLAAAHREWARKNPDKRRATDAKRKAAKLLATPKWADLDAIAAIYATAVEIQRATGRRMHVDHIVPLQSEIVCGLHCESNLQILPASLNESKRNFWWPDMPEEAYRQPRLFAEPAPKPKQASLLDGAA